MLNLGGSRIAVVVAFREISVSASVPVHLGSEGRRHIGQCEGGERDPLMPLHFSLAIHNVLVEVQANLQDDEHLFAFLDDVSPEWVRDILNREVSHSGKTRTWSKM